MAKSKMFLGHKNKTHWNVSLWINNDESLYRLALDFIAANTNRNDAARHMMLFLEQTGQAKIIGNTVLTSDVPFLKKLTASA